ncbi:MAG TPA: energy transducer TonB [Phenylobacterium sp.]|jgi:outer membrane biosynthesis protein TonB
MTRRELRPAMAASVVLHVTIAAALLISWNFTRDLKVGAVVPVTLVANAPQTDLREAEQAPVEQVAATPEPQPSAPAQSAAPPVPQPKPAPPPPKPTPIPKVVEPKSVPAPPKPAPAKPEKSLDLDALSASISKMAKPTPAKPSSAAKGPARPETALQARPALGTGASASAAISGLAEELQRRWNPNCAVEGGHDVLVHVVFTIGAGGQVVGDVASEIRSARNAVSQAGASRAVSAVYAAAPYRNLPREFYGEKISVNFNAREACS